jgi:hypothetical protein
MMIGHIKSHAAMHESNVHTTLLKISIPNFIEGSISMRYLMPIVEVYMTIKRDKNILYDLSQL